MSRAGLCAVWAVLLTASGAGSYLVLCALLAWVDGLL